MMEMGWMVGGRLDPLRREYAERWQQSDTVWVRIVGYIIGPDVFFRRRRNA
jgi:hypothetical protein